MLIAVTGSTGFIGTHLCRHLLRAGHTVRALSRSGRAADGVEVVRGDLDNTEALTALVSGAGVVIHLAASVRGACAADFEQPNVDGTRRLLEALDRRTTDTPLLFCSSLAAREPTLSWYASSKHAAEALVRRRSGPTLILRPPAVYGQGDTEMLPVFRFMARTGLAPCAGDPAQRLSLLHVDDLVAAMSAWVPVAATTRGTTCLHDGRAGGYDWNEIAILVGQQCGRRIRVWRVPRALLDGVAWLNVWRGHMTGTLPMLTPAKLRELRHPDWVCRETAADLLPGWVPRVELADGLRATPGWH